MADRDANAPTNIEELLAEARKGLARLSPIEASEAVAQGALLIDIRSDLQRWKDGLVPDSHRVPRNVLEWRLDPASPYRDPSLAQPDRKVVLLCDEGYQSSLAAATLRRFGVDATDVVGGFRAWRDRGLPVERDSSKPRGGG